jgi:hypothetical protein
MESIKRTQGSLAMYKSFNTLWAKYEDGGMNHGFSSINIFSLSCLILYHMQRGCDVFRESETKANASRQRKKNQYMVLHVYKLMETGAGWIVLHCMCDSVLRFFCVCVNNSQI